MKYFSQLLFIIVTLVGLFAPVFAQSTQPCAHSLMRIVRPESANKLSVKLGFLSETAMGFKTSPGLSRTASDSTMKIGTITAVINSLNSNSNFKSIANQSAEEIEISFSLILPTAIVIRSSTRGAELLNVTAVITPISSQNESVMTNADGTPSVHAPDVNSNAILPVVPADWYCGEFPISINYN